MTIKVDKLDALFSRFIRLRAGGYCQRCKKLLGMRSRGLHCAHYFSRGKKSVRWDKDNCASFCYGCHVYLDHHPLEKAEFFLELLGLKRFNELAKRAETLFPKPDKEALTEYYTQKVKELE